MTSNVASTISLLLGAGLSPTIGGISPAPVPKNAVWPYVTVQDSFSKELESLTGSSGLLRSKIQINCWDKDYENAWQLRAAIKSYLLPFKGTAGSQTIQDVKHGNDHELYDGQRELHQLILYVFIWWGS